MGEGSIQGLVVFGSLGGRHPIEIHSRDYIRLRFLVLLLAGPLAMVYTKTTSVVELVNNRQQAHDEGPSTRNP